MTHNEWADTPTGAGASARNTNAGEGEGALKGLAHDAKGAASEAISEAETFAGEKAEEIQSATAGHFRAFADAIRTAGDQLAENEPSQVADLVRRAAEGLEQLSDVMGRNSPSEMMDSVRDFGRQNPVGFIAGSMLVGFALARFAGSSAPEHNGGANRPNGGGDRHRQPQAGAGMRDRPTAGAYGAPYAHDGRSVGSAMPSGTPRSDGVSVAQGGRTDR